MKLPSLISLPDEPWLEKWARFFRYRQADHIIRSVCSQKTMWTLLDFGCGQDILYYHYIHSHFPSQAHTFSYIGVDPLISPTISLPKGVRIIKKKFEDVSISTAADVIVMFAVLEHVDDPVALLETAYNALKPGGVLILTTPSPLARIPLEFFSRILGIISIREIEEHKRYPTRAYLLSITKTLPHAVVYHTYFELGLNNFCTIKKPEATKSVKRESARPKKYRQG